MRCSSPHLKKTAINILFDFFHLLFGCTTANFGSFSSGKTSLSQCLSLCFDTFSNRRSPGISQRVASWKLPLIHWLKPLLPPNFEESPMFFCTKPCPCSKQSNFFWAFTSNYVHKSRWNSTERLLLNIIFTRYSSIRSGSKGNNTFHTI